MSKYYRSMSSAAIMNLENKMLLGDIVHTHKDAISLVNHLISINSQLSNFPKTSEKLYTRREGIMVELAGQSWAKTDTELKLKLFAKLSPKAFKNEISEINKSDVPFDAVAGILQRSWDVDKVAEEYKNKSDKVVDSNFEQNMIMYVNKIKNNSKNGNERYSNDYSSVEKKPRYSNYNSNSNKYVKVVDTKPNQCKHCAVIGHLAKQCQAMMCRWCSSFFSSNKDNNYHHHTTCKYYPYKQDSMQSIPAKVNMVNVDETNNFNNIGEQDIENLINHFDYDSVSEDNDVINSIYAKVSALATDLWSSEIQGKHLIFDSGASISISHPSVAKALNIQIYNYNKPIQLRYANNSTGKAYMFANFGPILGHVVLSESVTITLISTYMLSQRGIKYLNDEGSIQLFDREYDLMYSMEFTYNGQLPLVYLPDILRIDTKLYKFTQPINPEIIVDVSYLENINAVIPAKRKRESAVSLKEFKDVIDLHETTFHTSSARMSSNIRIGAWTNTNVLPKTIDRVFRKYDCEICAQAKWNRPAMQVGTQIAMLNIGQVISIDRIPITTSSKAGFTDFYLVVDRSVAYTIAFLDKTNNLKQHIVNLILYFRKWGYDIEVIRTDAGTKETSVEFKNLLAFYHVRLEPAVAEEQYCNPVERYVQYFKPATSAILASQTNLDQEFWPFALLAAVFAWNCSINSLSGDYSPLYHLTGKHPDISECFKYKFGQKLIISKSKIRGANFELKNK